MEKKIKQQKRILPEEDLSKSAQTPACLQRREALKRIAYLTIGTFTGSILINTSCEYDDYSDYSDYYSDYHYYSDAHYYYDYYSVYSVYWD